MRALVVGSGGREHALAWSLCRNAGLDELHAAPGNPGIAALAHCHPVRADDPAALVSLARELRIDLVVVGPEAPLVAGLADELRLRGIAAFGPSAAAAQIEGSKSFAKDVLEAAGVATARTLPVARPPCVLKLDGLAAGKGVWVCRTQDELDSALEAAQSTRPALPRRGAPRGPRALGLRPGRRRGRGRLSAGPRLQADRRRRHRPEHRRHGLLLAAARRRRRGGGRDPRGRAPAGAARARSPRHAVPGPPLRGPDANGGRPARDRVQLPLRRSRDAVAAASARNRPAAAARGRPLAGAGGGRTGPP